MTTYTESDFKRARFAAEHVDGSTCRAVRIDSDDRERPWTLDCTDTRLSDAEMVSEGWAPVRECGSDDLGQAILIAQARDEWKALAEKTEKERDEAQVELIAEQHRSVELLDRACAAERERDDARYGMKVAIEQRNNWESIARQAITEPPRPLTPDDITDEARERAYRATAALCVSEWDDLSGVAKGRVMTLVSAVIAEAFKVEPPARPGGAEEIEALLGHRDGPLAEAPDADHAAVANFLASKGVRAPGGQS